MLIQRSAIKAQKLVLHPMPSTLLLLCEIVKIIFHAYFRLYTAGEKRKTRKKHLNLCFVLKFYREKNTHQSIDELINLFSLFDYWFICESIRTRADVILTKKNYLIITCFIERFCVDPNTIYTSKIVEKRNKTQLGRYAHVDTHTKQKHDLFES